MGQVFSKINSQYLSFNNFSKKQFWRYFITHFLSGTIFYTFTLIIVYLKKQKSLDVSTNMKYSSNIISTINGILCSLCFIINLYRLKYWNDPQNCVHGKPGNVPLFFSWLMSYCLVDAIFRLYFIIKYDRDTIQPRWDMIAHHVFIFLVYPLWNVPNPIYYHSPLAIVMGVETSSPPLNLQWFATHYKASKRKKLFCKLLFVFTWFFGRLPSSLIMLAGLLKHRRFMIKNDPLRQAITAWILCICNLLMNGAWTVQIMRKFLAFLFKNKDDVITKVANAHAVSIEL